MIVGMVVSTRFLRQYAALDPSQLLDNKPLRTISDLCLGYFKDHAEAPTSHLNDLWMIRREELVEQGDEAQAELIDTILQSLGDEFEAAVVRFNTDYALSVAEKYLRLRKLKQVADQVRGGVSQKDPDQAESALVQYKPVRLVSSNGAVPTEQGFFDEIFQEEKEPPLLQFPGELGRMLNRQFFRSAFVAFLGTAKVGKSWLLQDVALRAWWQRCNVAYFVMGDMSLRQVKERLASTMTGRPVARFVDEAIWRVEEHCRRWDRCTLEERKPTRDCRACDKFMPRIVKEQVKLPAFTQRNVVEANRSWLVRTKGKALRTECYPTGTKSVRDIDGMLDGWEHFHGFLVDVVVIDYADILAPIAKRTEARDEINDTWQYMNQLAQRRNCLVVTATQSDAEGYGKRRLTKKNFSGDRRKNDHVSAQFDITMTQEEEAQEIVRVSEVAIRFGAPKGYQVVVHRSLGTGRFCGASEKEEHSDQQKGKNYNSNRGGE